MKTIQNIQEQMGWQRIARYAGYLLSACLYVLLFSRSTSPLYPLCNLKDSYIFQTIGRYWSGECIPYVDLFDHKGPLIFFVDALGWRLTGSSFGIFILQVICMVVVIVVTVKMFEKVFDGKQALLLTGVSLFGISAAWEGGNLTEEYILPFLMLSFYAFWNWAEDSMAGKEMRHRPVLGFLYGLTFGIALMTRVTNAAGICFVVLFVMIVLIKEHEWKNLGQNMCSFVAGCMLVVLPFVVYFTMHGALNEMWYGTIGFNFSYMENSDSFIQKGTAIKDIASFLMYFFGSYCMAFAGIFVSMKKERRFMGIFMIVASVGTTLMFALGRAYPHYCMICLPYFVISIMEFRRNAALVKQRGARYRGLAILFSALFLIGGAYKLQDLYLSVTSKEFNHLEQLVSSIPEDEKDSFIAWNCNPGIYLKYNIRPSYRYFALQPSQAKMSNELKKDICQTFEQGDVRWIVAKDGTQKMIQDVLDRKYDKIEDESGNHTGYVLYCIRE